MKRTFLHRSDARRELTNSGYMVAFSTPGRPELWVRAVDKKRAAIARVIDGADELWAIMAYPEPAVCTYDELAALAARDGPVLSAGKMLDTAPSACDDIAWLG